MTAVIHDLDARRTTAAADLEHRCSCGEAWFDLEIRSGIGQTVPGAVTVRSDGSVVGYTGTLVCRACRKAHNP